MKQLCPLQFAFVAIAVALTFPVDTAGIGTQSAGRSAAATRTTPSYATAPFDVEAETLPRGYAGMDPVRVATALKRVASPKGEFETTEVYNARIAQLLKTTPLYASLTVGDMLAFASIDTGSPEYDADTSQISIGVLGRGPFKTKLILGGALLAPPLGVGNTTSRGSGAFFPLQWQVSHLKRTEWSTSSYVTSNAFGASAKVVKNRGKAVSLLYWDTFCRTDEPERWSASVADAKAFKADPGVLLVGRVIPPYFSVEQVGTVPPTLDVPLDEEVIVEGIRFELHSLLFYLPQSGKILHRQRAVRENPTTACSGWLK